MKKFVYIMLVTVSFASPAFAADKTDGISSSIAVERIMCQPAMVHTPSNDVAYKPGVDVNGNPVASADLNPAPQAMPTTYTEVPLNIDLAKKLNLSQPAVMEGNFGNLKIYNDGRVVYNGQDITNQANVVCGRTGAAAIPAGAPQPVPQPKVVNSMAMPEVPMPGTAAPSSTTPAQ